MTHPETPPAGPPSLSEDRLAELMVKVVDEVAKSEKAFHRGGSYHDARRMSRDTVQIGADFSGVFRGAELNLPAATS